MKKSAGRKQRRMLARSNRRSAGRKRAAHNEWLQKAESRRKNRQKKETA